MFWGENGATTGRGLGNHAPIWAGIGEPRSGEDWGSHASSLWLRTRTLLVLRGGPSASTSPTLSPPEAAAPARLSGVSLSTWADSTARVLSPLSAAALRTGALNMPALFSSLEISVTNGTLLQCEFLIPASSTQ